MANPGFNSKLNIQHSTFHSYAIPTPYPPQAISKITPNHTQSHLITPNHTIFRKKHDFTFMPQPILKHQAPPLIENADGVHSFSPGLRVRELPRGNRIPNPAADSGECRLRGAQSPSAESSLLAPKPGLSKRGLSRRTAPKPGLRGEAQRSRVKPQSNRGQTWVQSQSNPGQGPVKAGQG